MRQIFDKDRRLSLPMIEEDCGILKARVHRISIDDLQMRKVYTKKGNEEAAFIGVSGTSCTLRNDPRIFGQSDIRGRDVDF